MKIGRGYSAAIERRKNNTDEDQNDDFYINVVAPATQSSQIDSWLKSARAAIPGTQSGFNTLVETHYEVTTLFSNISSLEKRSLASKYLHFHVPKLFYILDSRAVEAMRKFSPMLPRASPTIGLADNEYRKFAEKCFHLVQMSEHTFGLSPLPRQIDNLLLTAHARGFKTTANDAWINLPFSVRTARVGYIWPARCYLHKAYDLDEKR